MRRPRLVGIVLLRPQLEDLVPSGVGDGQDHAARLPAVPVPDGPARATTVVLRRSQPRRGRGPAERPRPVLSGRALVLDAPAVHLAQQQARRRVRASGVALPRRRAGHVRDARTRASWSIVAGLAVLATEFAWAERLLDQAKTPAAKAASRRQRIPGCRRVTASPSRLVPARSPSRRPRTDAGTDATAAVAARRRRRAGRPDGHAEPGRRRRVTERPTSVAAAERRRRPQPRC